jgi:hypothetical protein
MKMCLAIRTLLAALIVTCFAPPLIADSPAPAAKRVALEPQEAARTLPCRVLGSSAEALIEHLIDSPQKVAALKEVGPSLLRFPGGTYSNYYNWHSGLLDVEITPRSAPYKRFWAEVAPKIRTAMPHGVSVEDYTKFARQIGAEIVLVPNLETSSVADQVAWFRQMKAAGVVPRLIELGNEYWIATGMDPDVLLRWPDEPTSMRIMKEYCEALRPYYPPGAKVAVQAAASQYWINGSPTGTGGKRLQQWDADLKPADWFDAVTIHLYPRIDDIMGVRGASQGWRQHAEALRLFSAMLAHCDEGVDRVVADVRQRVPGKEIWVTEWGTRGVDFRGADQPTASMQIHLISRMTLALLRQREVTMSLFYTLNFLSRSQWCHFQSDGKGGYQPLPYVIAMQWFNEAANGGATWQRVLEAKANRIPAGGALGESYFEVEAALFHKPQLTTLLVHNCSAEPRRLSLTELPGGKRPQQIETLATPELMKTPAPGMPATVDPDAGGDVTLPPYSLTRIMWK